MEELVKEVARSIALGAEAGAILIIGYGTVEAFVLILKRFNRRWEPGTGRRRGCVWGCGFCWASNLSLRPISFGVSSHRPGSISDNWER